MLVRANATFLLNNLTTVRRGEDVEVPDQRGKALIARKIAIEVKPAAEKAPAASKTPGKVKGAE